MAAIVVLIIPECGGEPKAKWLTKMTNKEVNESSEEVSEEPYEEMEYLDQCV